MTPEESNVRKELMRLVPLVAVEGTRIVEAFADQQRLHQTDVEALSFIMVADVQDRSITAGALGEELGVTSGATTFAINRLECAGLVTRVRDPKDQRKVFLQLSKAGRALADTFYAPVLQASHAVMDQFSPAELEVVRRFLAATTAAMAAHRDSLSHQP